MHQCMNAGESICSSHIILYVCASSLCDNMQLYRSTVCAVPPTGAHIRDAVKSGV